MRYHEITTNIDFGPRYKWTTTLALPVSRDNWAEWKEIIKAHGVDLLLRIDKLTSDPDTRVMTVGCPSKQIAKELDEAWSAVIRRSVK